MLRLGNINFMKIVKILRRSGLVCSWKLLLPNRTNDIDGMGSQRVSCLGKYLLINLYLYVGACEGDIASAFRYL